MGFESVREQLANDIEYWSGYISRKSGLEKDDASQELLIIVWELYCKKKEVNKYFLQQRLKWESLKMLKNFYIKENTAYIEDLFPIFIIPDPEAEKRAERFFEKEIFAQLVRNLKEKDSLAYKIINALLEQKSRKEICSEFGICRGYLSQIIATRIRPGLRKIYET